MMIEIRCAETSDIPQIVQLTTALSQKFIVPDCTAEGTERLLTSMNEEETAKRFAGPYRYFVACESDEIVGVVATREDSHLYHLFVTTSRQRRGLARNLWRIARQACCANGNCGRFTVNSSRGSQKVYEAFGFVAQDEVCVNGVPFIPMTLEIVNG